MAKEISLPDFLGPLKAMRNHALGVLAEHITAEYLKGIESDANHLVSAKGIAVEEGGHIHEAVLNAVLPLKSTLPELGTLTEFSSKRSGDAKAANKANARVTRNDQKGAFSVTIKLPFAVAMEEGGKVSTRSPHGRKVEGGLYGQRSRLGRGALIWRDSSGAVHFKKERKFSGTQDGVGALKRAATSTDALAKSMGWSKK